MTLRFMRGEFGVHCETRELAKKFLCHLNNYGVVWNGTQVPVVDRHGDVIWHFGDETQYNSDILNPNTGRAHGDVGIRHGMTSQSSRKSVKCADFFHDKIY